MAHAMRIALMCAALLLLSTGRPATGQAADRVGWIGIFTPELVEWLENGNRLAELCGSEDKDSAAFQQLQDRQDGDRRLTWCDCGRDLRPPRAPRDR